MTPSRGWESQPLRSKKLQALLLLIAGVRVWLGCVLESGRGQLPPPPPLLVWGPRGLGGSVGHGRNEAVPYRARCITLVSRVYYVCICLVSCVYRARWCIMRVSVCIGVYRCVTISLIHITLADQGEIHVSRCITRVLRAYRRVSTRLRCNTRRIADTSLNDVIQLEIQ